eukprot:2962804-Prymnesium_polylepis.1
MSKLVCSDIRRGTHGGWSSCHGCKCGLERTRQRVVSPRVDERAADRRTEVVVVDIVVVDARYVVGIEEPTARARIHDPDVATCHRVAVCEGGDCHTIACPLTVGRVAMTDFEVCRTRCDARVRGFHIRATLVVRCCVAKVVVAAEEALLPRIEAQAQSTRIEYPVELKSRVRREFTTLDALVVNYQEAGMADSIEFRKIAWPPKPSDRAAAR